MDANTGHGSTERALPATEPEAQAREIRARSASDGWERESAHAAHIGDVSSTTRFVFAGGGTGGHLYPSLAIIRELRQLAPAAAISFFCTDRPIDRKILDGAGIEAVPQAVRPFSTKPWRWPAFLFAWQRAIARCTRAFRERRPSVVVGAGGYGSDPPVRAAMKLGIPTAILNPDFVPGKANIRLGPKVARIFAQWDGTRKYFEGAVGFRTSGCPIRPEFASARREQGIARFNLDPARRTLLVTGASQGARTINDTLIALAPELAKSQNWQILHLTGPADAVRVEAAYRQAGLRGSVLAYTDQMPEAMAAADFAVSRAGASTLAELTAVGLPSVLLPYPYHKDQHQRHNAEVLAQAGAAAILDDHIDTAANTGALRPILTAIMGEPAKLDRMKAAARSLGKPDAARDIAKELIGLAQSAAGN
jgi:UDP-N-acetylglucosamine--N-acetylmuramyl-(pentapeptide) pyrophosphoryl-undecaprenol N-acetylglucosamine transferase